MMRVGFIGLGHMGHGMADNMLPELPRFVAEANGLELEPVRSAD